MPSSSATQSTNASAITPVASHAGAPSNRGSAQARTRAAANPAKPHEQEQLDDTQQVATGAEHLRLGRSPPAQ